MIECKFCDDDNCDIFQWLFWYNYSVLFIFNAKLWPVKNTILFLEKDAVIRGLVCPSISLSVGPSICRYVHCFVNPPVCPCICQFVPPLVRLSIRTSIHLVCHPSIRLSVCPSIHFSVHHSVCSSIYPSTIHPSFEKTIRYILLLRPLLSRFYGKFFIHIFPLPTKTASCLWAMLACSGTLSYPAHTTCLCSFLIYNFFHMEKAAFIGRN